MISDDISGSWGRPQTDGPAIRATVLIKFANLLLDAGEGEYVASHLYDNNTPVSLSSSRMGREIANKHWVTGKQDD